jgi:hypothetical protein
MKKAIWVWDSHYPFTQPLKFYNFLQDKEVDKVYLQINSAIPMTQYQTLSTKLNSLGIQLFALDGDPNWVNDPSLYANLLTMLKGQSAIFSGLHLDIEPYLLPSWNNDRQGTITKLQNTISQFYTYCQSRLYRLELAIPFWYDNDLLTFLLNHSDEVVVMAYRNFAEGGNGTIDITSRIIDLADQLNKKVSIGVETTNLPENYTSFFNLGENAMIAELEKVRQTFQPHRSFHGVAIHDLAGWMTLKM